MWPPSSRCAAAPAQSALLPACVRVGECVCFPLTSSVRGRSSSVCGALVCVGGSGLRRLHACGTQTQAPKFTHPPLTNSTAWLLRTGTPPPTSVTSQQHAASTARAARPCHDHTQSQPHPTPPHQPHHTTLQLPPPVCHTTHSACRPWQHSTATHPNHSLSTPAHSAPPQHPHSAPAQRATAEYHHSAFTEPPHSKPSQCVSQSTNTAPSQRPHRAPTQQATTAPSQCPQKASHHMHVRESQHQHSAFAAPPQLTTTMTTPPPHNEAPNQSLSGESHHSKE